MCGTSELRTPHQIVSAFADFFDEVYRPFGTFLYVAPFKTPGALEISSDDLLGSLMNADMAKGHGPDLLALLFFKIL